MTSQAKAYFLSCVLVIGTWVFVSVYLIPIYFDVKFALNAYNTAIYKLDKQREEFEIQQAILTKYFWGNCYNEKFRLIEDLNASSN